MISAGNDIYGQNQVPQQQGYYNPGGYAPGGQGGFGGQQQAGPMIQSPQGVAWQKTGMGAPQMSVSGRLSESHTYEMMNKQQTWAGVGMITDAVGQTLSTVLNASLQSKALQAQAKVASKYYETQDNIASYQRDVAIRQLAVQEKAINAQQDMHGEQMRHEEKMLQLEGSIQGRLESIRESGKNRRAEILSAQDAFRSGWNMGSPTLAA